MTTPIKLELAKLLKEKGFDKKVFNYFDTNYEAPSDIYCLGSFENWNTQPNLISAPTIAEVVMWLYEKYGIWVYSYSVAPYLLDEEDYPKIVFVSKVQKFKEFDIFVDTDNGLAVNHYSSPTEAYEAAIGYCLTNLI